MRRDVRSSRPRLRKTRLPAVRLEAAEKARIGLFRAVRKIALRTLQEVFARMRPRGRLLLRLPSLIGGFFCSTATLSIVIVFAMKFFRQAVFSVSCAFAAVALPVGCSSAPAPTPDAPDGGDRSEYTYTLSQKKLLEIIAEQKVFFERVRTNSKMSRSDAVSLRNRLDSLWAEYFAEHPEDVDALLIHGKYLRAVGDDEALHLARTVDLTGGSYQLAGLYGQWYKFAFVCVPDVEGQNLGTALFTGDTHDFQDYGVNYHPVLTYQATHLREAQGKDLAIYRKVIDRWVDAVNPTSEDVVLGRQTGELVLDMGKLKDQFENPVTQIDLVLTDVVDRMFVRDKAVDSVIVNTALTNNYTFLYPVYADDDPDQRVVISYALLPGQLTSAKVQVTYTTDGTTRGTTEITLADEDATPITIKKNVRTTVLFNGMHPDEFEVRYAGFDDGNDATIDVDDDKWDGE